VINRWLCLSATLCVFFISHAVRAEEVANWKTLDFLFYKPVEFSVSDNQIDIISESASSLLYRQLTVSGVAHEMRVIKTDMEANGLMKINAVAEDVSSYDFYTPPGETSRNITSLVLVPDTLLQFVDASLLPVDTVQSQGLLRLGVAPDGADWDGAAIYRSDDGGEDGGKGFYNHWMTMPQRVDGDA